MCRRFILMVGVLSSTIVFGANPTLKFKVNGFTNTTVYLANYYGNKLYYSDTAQADAKGWATFGAKKTYEPGVYAVVMPGNKYFEIILNNENVVMETDSSDMAGKMVVKESKENKIFYEYVHFINAKRKEADPLREKLKDMDEKSNEAEEIRNKLLRIDESVKDKQKEIHEKYPTTLVGKIIWLSVDPEIPKNPDPTDSTYNYRYTKAHYFDHFDFTDQRLVRCPFFHNKIENYFKNMILQSPDSMIVEGDRLLDQLDKAGNKEMFKYVLHHLTYTTETSKIMCMDAAFVHFAFKYYKTGKAFWLTEDKVKKITERADEISGITCKSLAHPLSMMDSTGKWKRLYDLHTDFTLLIFWDPECGHCKKEMPKFAEVYSEMKNKGYSVSVYSVSSDFNDKWKKFVKDNNMGDFINVSIPHEYYEKQEKAIEQIRLGNTDLKSLNFRTTFDIYSTPKVFLLDKDKRIIAKQMEAEQAKELIEFYSKRAEQEKKERKEK